MTTKEASEQSKRKQQEQEKKKKEEEKKKKAAVQKKAKGDKENDEGINFDTMDPDKLDWRQMFLQEKMVGEPQSIP